MDMEAWRNLGILSIWVETLGLHEEELGTVDNRNMDVT
jgi:hypothetical protein